MKTDQDSKKLDSDVVFALLGIHKRHQNLAHEPSKLDIDLLKQLYGGEFLLLLVMVVSGGGGRGLLGGVIQVPGTHRKN